jgi:hypothetical protein
MRPLGFLGSNFGCLFILSCSVREISRVHGRISSRHSSRVVSCVALCKCRYVTKKVDATKTSSTLITAQTANGLTENPRGAGAWPLVGRLFLDTPRSRRDTLQRLPLLVASRFTLFRK